MKDERFRFPLLIVEGGRIEVAFRKRNHMVPCTSRWRKTYGKKMQRLVSLFFKKPYEVGPIQVRSASEFTGVEVKL